MSIHNETCPKCGNVFEPDLGHTHDDVLAKLDSLAAENRRMRDILDAGKGQSAISILYQENERLRSALEDISNHGTDLPAVLAVSDDHSDGYRRGLRSCGAIARTALEPTP